MRSFFHIFFDFRAGRVHTADNRAQAATKIQEHRTGTEEFRTSEKPFFFVLLLAVPSGQ